MTLTVRLILIVALVFSIIIPFGYYLIGEKNRGRYKCALAANVFFFFGACLVASIMMFAGPNVQAADAAASASTATGLGSGYRFILYRRWYCRGKCGERGAWSYQ